MEAKWVRICCHKSKSDGKRKLCNLSKNLSTLGRGSLVLGMVNDFKSELRVERITRVGVLIILLVTAALKKPLLRARPCVQQILVSEVF